MLITNSQSVKVSMLVNSWYTCCLLPAAPVISTFTWSQARSLVITGPWCHHNINNQLLHNKSSVNNVMTDFLQLYQGQTTYSFSIIGYKIITVKLSTEIAVIVTDNFGPRWFGWLEETNDRNVFRAVLLVLVLPSTPNISRFVLNLWS